MSSASSYFLAFGTYLTIPSILFLLLLLLFIKYIMQQQENQKILSGNQIIQSIQQEATIAQIENSTKGSALYALYQLKEKTDTLKCLLKSRWRPPKHIRAYSKLEVKKILSNFHIEVQGMQIPPPIATFQEMRFPKRIINILQKRGYHKPTPLQMQSIPAILSGRDVIGISATNTGKTLSFVLPCIIHSLQQQLKLPIILKEGPFSVIITPSHELAMQINQTIKQIFLDLNLEGFPKLNQMLCIGGYNIKQQLQEIKNGVHIIVATPGRLSHMLDKKEFNLKMCRFLVMDEADRLLDLGFQIEMNSILQNFQCPYQTLVYCSSMSKQMLENTKYVLYKPVVIKVKDVNTINSSLLQQFEYLKPEQKTNSLIEALKKTPPSVIIFCENKNQCDNLHLYLLLKGLQVTCLHGGKDQEERSLALKEFQEMKKDILVATDVAAKGLQFSHVKHIINYDMPRQIQGYKQRLARISSKNGRSTTFVTKSTQLQTLQQLKQVLAECKQKMPTFLKLLDSKLLNNK